MGRGPPVSAASALSFGGLTVNRSLTTPRLMIRTCPMISTPSASPSAKPAQARDDFAQVMDELDSSRN